MLLPDWHDKDGKLDHNKALTGDDEVQRVPLSRGPLS
jgi:hypothetical protein